MDIAQVPLGRIISGSFVTITLGMHDPREPERARKGPKGPDEASASLICGYTMRLQNQRFPVSKHKRITELKKNFEMSHNILLGSPYGENQSVSGLFLSFLKRV